MATVSHKEFEKQSVIAIIIIVVIAIFSIVKIVKNINVNQYTIILIVSILCIAEVLSLRFFVKEYVTSGVNKIKFWQGIIFDWTLVISLGALSIYIFAFKGVYGLYLVIFKHFNFWQLLYRIAIIYTTYRLVVATDAIQTVYLSVKKGKQ